MSPIGLFLFLIASTPEACPAVVVGRMVEVHARPDERSFLTATLNRGARVNLRSERPDGWSVIDASPNDFDWVDAALLRTDADGLLVVVVDGTPTRAGCREAKLPGPPGVELKKGVVVERIGRPDLVMKGPSSTVTWIAVKAVPDSRRYVRTRDVRPFRAAFADEPADVAVRAAGMGDPPLPPEVSDELVRIDASRRSVLREPLENWSLDPVLKRYETLAKSTSDPAAGTVLASRIAEVRREAALADSARKFAELMKRSRRRDGEVERIRASLDDVKRADAEAYTAVGLIQPSSKEIEGRRVHLLIGSDGNNIAYLDVPPGVDVDHRRTRRVGVRGSLRYDEKLGARYIVVREIEPLGASD